MFGLSLKLTKKLLEAGASSQTPLGELTTHPSLPGPLSGIEPLGASTHGRPKEPPATQNASREILAGDKKLGGDKV